jgi:hypothetical protein
MKNKQVFAGILAVVLVFGLVFTGCPTDGDDKSSSGDNPLADKSYESDSHKWVFYPPKNYKYFINFEDEDVDPIWVEHSNGTYEWSATTETVTLIPQLYRYEEDDVSFLKEADYKTRLQEYHEDTTDNDVVHWTDDEYTTVEAYINGIVKEYFEHQTYSYTIEGNKIVSLTKK